MTDPLDALVASAGRTRVVVVGAGVSGLVAAMEFAKIGMQVTVLEETDRVGGVLRSAEVAGLRLDVGAESFAVRGGHVRALIDDLGLGDAVVAPSGGPAWVAGIPGGAAPLPRGGLLGIPANPWDPAVRRVIGWGGAWRAYLDRLRPPLTIGHDRSLGHLVRSRMGAAVLDRLVAPVTAGVYSARPEDVDVDLAAPGLNAALTRAGSLSGAVTALVGERASAPGAAVAGLDGGMTRLAEALAERVTRLGGLIRVATRAEGLRRDEDGWVVAVAAAAEDPASGVPAEAEELRADAVVVATTEPDARRLLAPVVPGLAPEGSTAPVVEVVTLVLRAPALDAAPRGTGVLTVPGAFPAKALTHSTAKWGWLTAAAGPGIHAVRVSFGAQGEAPATEGLSDEDAADLAREQAAALLGVDLAPSSLLGARRDRYVQSQPGSVIGRAAAVAAARGAIRAVPGLGAVGAWLSGTGLAQVVPDAVAEAEQVRRGVLWDLPPTP